MTRHQYRISALSCFSLIFLGFIWYSFQASKRAIGYIIVSGFVLFWTNNSRTFQGLSNSHFPFFRDFKFSTKKSLESMSFLVLSLQESFYPKGFSVFAPSSLEFYLNYKVSIEIQGLSSTDCNFQGLSRTWIYILKFKDFQPCGKWWVISHQYRISALSHFPLIFLGYIQYGFHASTRAIWYMYMYSVHIQIM